MESSRKMLLAIDFDHTLIDENSDLWVKRLAPDGKLPDHIEALYSSTGWTEYMGSIFQYLYEIGTKEEDIRKCMEEIPLTEGMADLLKYCNDKSYEIIIISDSNSVFIDMILEHTQLQKMVTKVFTNPAHFDDTGCLKIEYYHHQDWCDLSTINLCKGNILQSYLEKRGEEGINFDYIFYIGDGTNDFCPALTLKETDYVCPRINFRLWKKIQKLKNPESSESTKEELPQLHAQILNWSSGLDILEQIKQLE
ncbi:probable phosphatase phospho2 [Mytilus trossulus]|uniref:probable phosphatase phospho2 n=1 Tax=Mytilus trossulus TaxID=6551 RepID=UPI00300578F3